MTSISESLVAFGPNLVMTGSDIERSLTAGGIACGSAETTMIFANVIFVIFCILWMNSVPFAGQAEQSQTRIPEAFIFCARLDFPLSEM